MSLNRGLLIRWMFSLQASPTQIFIDCSYAVSSFVFFILILRPKWFLFIFSSPSQCRNIFGSTCHSKHAMFKESFIEHYGKIVGFTKPSETWFDGNLWLLRLKQPMLMCVCKPKFVKKKKHREVVLVLQKECVWYCVFSVCLAFHLIMQLIYW